MNKAWAVTYYDLQGHRSIMAGPSAGKVRYQVWRASISYWDGLRFADIRVVRAREFDAVAFMRGGIETLGAESPLPLTGGMDGWGCLAKAGQP